MEGTRAEQSENDIEEDEVDDPQGKIEKEVIQQQETNEKEMNDETSTVNSETRSSDKYETPIKVEDNQPKKLGESKKGKTSERGDSRDGTESRGSSSVFENAEPISDPRKACSGYSGYFGKDTVLKDTKKAKKKIFHDINMIQIEDKENKSEQDRSIHEDKMPSPILGISEGMSWENRNMSREMSWENRNIEMVTSTQNDEINVGNRGKRYKNWEIEMLKIADKQEVFPEKLKYKGYEKDTYDRASTLEQHLLKVLDTDLILTSTPFELSQIFTEEYKMKLAEERKMRNRLQKKDMKTEEELFRDKCGSLSNLRKLYDNSEEVFDDVIKGIDGKIICGINKMFEENVNKNPEIISYIGMTAFTKPMEGMMNVKVQMYIQIEEMYEIEDLKLKYELIEIEKTKKHNKEKAKTLAKTHRFLIETKAMIEDHEIPPLRYKEEQDELKVTQQRKIEELHGLTDEINRGDMEINETPWEENIQTIMSRKQNLEKEKKIIKIDILEARIRKCRVIGNFCEELIDKTREDVNAEDKDEMLQQVVKIKDWCAKADTEIDEFVGISKIIGKKIWFMQANVDRQFKNKRIIGEKENKKKDLSRKSRELLKRDRSLEDMNRTDENYMDKTNERISGYSFDEILAESTEKMLKSIGIDNEQVKIKLENSSKKIPKVKEEKNMRRTWKCDSLGKVNEFIEEEYSEDGREIKSRRSWKNEPEEECDSECETEEETESEKMQRIRDEEGLFCEQYMTKGERMRKWKDETDGTQERERQKWKSDMTRSS